MTRNLKFLGVLIVIALALCAVTANVSSADLLTAEQTPVALTGSMDGGSDEFAFDFGSFKCINDKHSGTVSSSPVSTISVTSAYVCSVLGGVTFHMNGCTYLFHINSGGSTAGTTDIVCPTGKEITVTWPASGTPACVIHIPSQSGLSGVSFATVGSATTREVTVNLALTFRYAQTKGSSEVGSCATGDNTFGTYNGRILFTAASESSGSHVGIFLS